MKALVRQYPIGSFIVGAFAFSWIIWIIAIVFVPESSQIMWIVPGAYGPTVMAIVVTAFASGASGVRRLLSKFLIWRVGILWYLAVFTVIPLIQLSGVFLYELLNPGSTGPLDPAPISVWLLTILLAIPIGPLAEELGWSGYLIPRLQGRKDALSSSLILGVVWGLWHLPLFWAPFGVWVVNDPVRLWSAGTYVLGTVTLRVIYTWIYNNTRGSVLLAVLLHAVSNAAIPFLLYPDISEAAAQMMKHLAVIPSAIVAVAIAVIFGRKWLSRKALVEGETMISSDPISPELQAA